jgi:hypothetical protein
MSLNTLGMRVVPLVLLVKLRLRTALTNDPLQTQG